MGQAYSDPERTDLPHALPDVEVFYHLHGKRERCWTTDECIIDDDEGDCLGSGWYWRACFPGCLPDSDPVGPFDTEAIALADARGGAR